MRINANIYIADDEIEFNAIRAQGSGGQNVNKVSSAVHLRFDIKGSSLPQLIKDKLLAVKDQKISKDGIIIIKAQEFRSLESNKEAARARLKTLVQDALAVRKHRKPTKPTKGSVKRRLNDKVKRGQIKKNRSKVEY